MTLQWYFARRFAMSFLSMLSIFAGLIWMTDMVESLRSLSSESFGLREAAGLALLQLPGTIYEVVPLIMVLATITLFLKMARTSELIVTRAAGRSAIRSLIAPVLVAALIGGIGISVVNPIVASTSRIADETRDTVRGRATNVLSLSRNGLWLRQAAQDGQIVIHAAGVSPGGTALYDVTFLRFDQNALPLQRIAAARAELVPGAWDMTGVKTWDLSGRANPEASAVEQAWMRLPSDLTLNQIRDSFGEPSAIPIWQLPAFIAQLEAAGFAALNHRVWLQSELASPIFLISMVLIGAAFTMRHTRFGRTGLMVLFAVLLGFAMYFLKSFALVLGETGKIPVLIAAWFPPLAGICLALALLLHQEDG
ncbi:MAG: LPS export ABC transporter permease LptG [Pseudomonadota bacterium]